MTARAAWADIPDAPAHLPGPAFFTAVVPDEDLAREPKIVVYTIHERVIPYEVMRWYMEKVAQEVEQCRAALMESSQGEA